MTKLHEIIAVEKGVRVAADRPLTDAYHTIQKGAPFTGLTKTYQPRDEEGTRYPDEATRVQERVEPDILAKVAKAQTRLFDVVFTKEVADQSANADVVVDDEALLTDIPVTYLMFLEKQLIHIRTFVTKLPVLDPAKEWSWDTNSRANVTPPREAVKTKKTVKPVVRWAPPTPEYRQEAQTEMVSFDEVEGYWTTRDFSGAIPEQRKQQLLDRVDVLIEAVKTARERANGLEITDQHAGAIIFDYLFGA